MNDTLTPAEHTPPSGLPEIPLEPCHTGAAAASCGACWAIQDLLNERARHG
jgi:hypothetical protein